MLKRGYKLVISVVLILALFCGLSVTSFAAFPLENRFKAWIATALMAANITIESSLAPVQSLFDTLSYGAGLPWTPSYTYQGPSWDDEILDRSSIIIKHDSVVIDGISYTDVWLSNDASQKFRVNVGDIETAWNIVSNSNGTYASGEGFVDGLPFFHVGSYDITQTTSVPFSGSYIMSNNIAFETIPNQFGNASSIYFYNNGVNFTYLLNQGSNLFPYRTRFRVGSNDDVSLQIAANSGNFSNLFYPLSVPVVRQNFDFDWVSGTIEPQTLPGDYMLHIRVPSSHSDSSSGQTIYDFGDIVQEFPDVENGYQINLDPSLNPDFQIDQDLLDTLGDLLNTILNVWDLLKDAPTGTEVEYAPYEEPVPPQPEPDYPDPEIPIGDQDPTWLDSLLRWLKDAIDELGTRLEAQLQDIYHEIEQNFDAIRDWMQSLPDVIREDLETAPIKVYQKALSLIKTLFAPILALLNSVIGLWHYVVEWVNSVSIPFLTFFNIMSLSSYNMVLPIYAGLAGAIVIAVYKRFGR